MAASEVSAEEAREWLLKHLATAPERDEAWYRRVLNIYAPGAVSLEQVVTEEATH